MKPKTIRQTDSTDCGPACLATVLAHYGRLEPLYRMRALCGTTHSGTSMLSLLRAAKAIGLDAKAYGAAVSEPLSQSGTRAAPRAAVSEPLSQSGTRAAPRADIGALLQLELPAILHWEHNHYVVLFKLTAKKALIGDPGEGTRWISTDTLATKWTGKVMWLKPKLSFERGHFVGKRGVPGLLAHFAHFRGSALVLAQLVVLSVVSGVLGLASPVVSQLVFDRVLTFREDQLLKPLLVAIFGMAIFGALVATVRAMLATHFALKLDYRLHLSYFDHLLRLPVGTLETRLSGDLVSRFGDLSKIREVLSEFVIAVPTNVLMLLFGYGLLFTYNTKLALLTLLAVPIYLIQVVLLWPKIRENSREIMKKSAEASSFLLSTLEGIHSLKALRGELWSFARARNQTSHLMALGWKNFIFDLWSSTGIGFLNQLLSLLMLWYGASMVLRLELTVGQLVAAYGVMGTAMGAMGTLVGLVSMLQDGSVASDRLAEIVELEPEKLPVASMELAPLAQTITVDNVCFAYGNGAAVLQNACFSLAKGSYTVLLGPNGAGKSTLAALFARMAQPSSGRILWDERDICSPELAPDQVRERVVYLKQEVPLMYATLRENLLFAQDVPDENLWAILEAVGLGRVAKRLPEGLDTVIGGESIFRLSTGEKQMLGLARVLASPAELVILDEPTATLDTEREQQIVELLAALKTHKTFLIITHRPALLAPADQVLQLSNGLVSHAPQHNTPTIAQETA